MRQQPPSGIRPTFLTSMWIMWPGVARRDLARCAKGFAIDVEVVQAVQAVAAQDPRDRADRDGGALVAEFAVDSGG